MLKKTIKKNQVIIAALTVVLGVAGYINFAGGDMDLSKDNQTVDGDIVAGSEAAQENIEDTEAAFAGDEAVAESAGEITLDDIEYEENIVLNSDEENIGEAVLTSANPVATNMISVKLNREQVRSKAKENYLEIINGDGMEESAVQVAREAYVKLTEDMEKEAEAETMLMAKGFEDVIVSISENSVDVVIKGTELDDVTRAQIEEIVMRKTGCNVDQIVISLMEQ